MSSPSRPGCRALRRGRVSIPGQCYSLTTVTAGRRPALADLWCARAVVRSLQELDQQHLCTTLAFVVMPDHVHWLVELDVTPLDHIMRVFKSRSARRISALPGGTRPLWQRGYHDHAIRTEESLVAAARYIVANPLRAGLVERIGDYPFWDSVWV